MSRLSAHGRRWLAAVVAALLIVPAGAWLVAEISFRRSGAAVVATLGGELEGAAVADTVLLVRAVGCAGTSRSGSAFVVATDDGQALLTNRHVVADSRTVGVRSIDGSTEVRVTGVRVSTSADVAVLEVAEPGDLPPALALRAATPAVGEAVRLVGFPAATPFTTEGVVAAATSTQVLLDLEVDAGASGSPVVDVQGQVVGQVFGVLEDGRGVATPTDVLVGAIADARPTTPC